MNMFMNDQFASRLGISQGQYANTIRRHDPISSFAMNRARALLVAPRATTEANALQS